MKVRVFKPNDMGIHYLFLVKETKATVSLLKDRIVFVDVEELTKAELARLYHEVTQVTEEKIERVLKGFKQNALYAGMSEAAAEHLPTLIPMTKKEIEMAKAKGNANGANKAPRKLAGAALAAKLRREEREAAEAAALKGSVEGASKELTAAEKAGAADVRVDPKPDRKHRKPANNQAKREAIGNAAVAARSAKFDAAKLKGPDGRWKSASAMFKGLILDNEKAPKAKKQTDEQIFKAVQAEFDLGDDKAGYVKWNRGWLVRNGVLSA